ncbi:LytTR family transcriptional regulator DNA-binding domain-containing protein [Reichenbachiella agarivorans]|uniref:LytTR family transcriptional regulator DNA-binding domain-containing protein n=1 Tax=Reichenbachiella agarivorans TaxID=2979464 RepID=A0ABY6CP01_9BACT|nr:LytTR family transcriptional regulator DNA-binding domain-containing protein [Reichenbachiella agarivorans]UXP32104.1 LytTR family transcriptional regulator DNA-binding domain-containing protein [Reichenbachiella agarivorans]
MDAYNILIVEDDSQIAESLSEILEILNHKVVGIAESYDQAVSFLEKDDIELVLLDIQIKGTKSGIDVAERIRADFKVPFIFTTAFADKETIKKASTHSPYGYIVKPYGIKDINAGIEIAIENHKNFKSAKSSDEGVFNRESLFVKANSRIVRINIDDILYIEAKGDYAIFKTLEKGYIVHTTFKNVENSLDPDQFVKVHRSYIVNVNKVVDIEENNLLINEQVIPISRGQRGHLLSKLNPI